jgi:transcriptional regulator
LIGIIRRKAGEKIAGNKVDRQFEVLILRSGRIII